MKNRKRTLKGFSYWELDDFAQYLHDMSEKGWHFTGWQIGMIFEKGEPADISYAAEVFPKGSEMDTRPESNTEEYADYCEAAGWKLIDSKQKLCVYKKVREEAISIVTPRERFANIKKASWRKWVGEMLTIVLAAACFYSNFFTGDLGSMIFSDVVDLAILTGLFGCFWKLAECIFMVREAYKKKKQLEEGMTPFYGIHYGAAVRNIKNYGRAFWILIILLTAYAQATYFAIILVLIICSLLVNLLLALKRPSRCGNLVIQLGGGFGIGFLIMLVALVVAFWDYGIKSVPVNQKDIPLVQGDFCNVQGKITETKREYVDGILGTQVSYDVQYKQKAANDVIVDDMWYQIYNTKHHWILKWIWEIYKEKAYHAEDCTQEWGAQSAICSPEDIYTVLYQGKLLVLSSGKNLDKKQIEIIRNKLGLALEGEAK